MKLLSGPTSPFARKCRIVAFEKSIILSEIDTNPFTSDELASLNPLKMIPVLILENDEQIYDSDIICRFLDDSGEGISLYPKEKHWDHMVRASLGNGLAEASVQLQLQKVLPKNQQSTPLMDRLRQRINRVLSALDDQLLDLNKDSFKIDSICVIAGIGHLELRHGDSWQKSHKNLFRWYSDKLNRPSVVATQPIT